MVHEITYENMFANYSKYISDKYRDNWGLHDDFMNKSDEYKAGSICFMKRHFAKWIAKLLYDRCVAEEFPGLLVLDDENGPCVTESEYDKYTCIMEDYTVAPFKCDGWYDGKSYIIKFTSEDEIGKFLMILAQILHEYGVESEKYHERGFVDPAYINNMFRAIIMENIINQIFPIVESALRRPQ